MSVSELVNENISGVSAFKAAIPITKIAEIMVSLIGAEARREPKSRGTENQWRRPEAFPSDLSD